MSQSAICRTCRFFHPEVTTHIVGNEQGEGHGECRIKAPRIFRDVDGDTGQRIWPAVFENDWCGEYVSDDA